MGDGRGREGDDRRRHQGRPGLALEQPGGRRGGDQGEAEGDRRHLLPDHPEVLPRQRRWWRQRRRRGARRALSSQVSYEGRTGALLNPSRLWPPKTSCAIPGLATRFSTKDGETARLASEIFNLGDSPCQKDKP